MSMQEGWRIYISPKLNNPLVKKESLECGEGGEREKKKRNKKHPSLFIKCCYLQVKGVLNCFQIGAEQNVDGDTGLVTNFIHLSTFITAAVWDDLCLSALPASLQMHTHQNSVSWNKDTELFWWQP